MHLRDYLSVNNKTLASFSDDCGIPKTTMSKYKYGTRIPSKDNMVKIYHVTQGTVEPNDFYLK